MLREFIIRYGITIYGHASSYKLNTLNSILHKTAHNIIYGTRHHGDRTEIIMKESDILHVKKQLVFEVLYKHFFYSPFKVDNIKSRCLRQTERFVLPRVLTGHGKKTRLFFVPFYFNKIDAPPTINCPSQAKKYLKEWVRKVDIE